MAKARAIIKRHKAVQNIRKITRTMQLIATARYQRSYSRAVGTKPFTQKLTELVRELSANREGLDHPLLATPETVKRVALVTLTSNRGLCGGYNGNLQRLLTARLRELEALDACGEFEEDAPVDLYVSGKKGISYCRFLGYPVAATYTTFERDPQFADVEPIADELIGRFVSGEVDRVDVIYMRFESTAVQTPACMTLLPMEAPVDGEGGAESATRVRHTEYEFSPAPAELLAELLPLAVKTRLFQCFIDAAVSEQVARMVAMKAATDAAGDMLKQLQQAYNRARQTQITLELLDIVGGANALS